MFGLFKIEAGLEPEAVTCDEGKPLVYETGKEAAEACARAKAFCLYECLPQFNGCKLQPRRLADDAWKTREMGRFAHGTYVALPWADLPTLSITADHYAHVSTIEGAKIAYTQDAAKGAGDIQTRVKPGKYLQQFYGAVLDAPTIARMSAEFSVQYGDSLTLSFAKTGGAYAIDDCLQLEDGTTWSKDWFADNGLTVDGKHYAKGDEPTPGADAATEASDCMVSA